VEVVIGTKTSVGFADRGFTEQIHIVCNIHCPISDRVLCTGTLLHKATHRNASFRPFRVTGNGATFAAIPVCRQSGSAHCSFGVFIGS
jgi:hypothetical protein